MPAETQDRTVFTRPRQSPLVRFGKRARDPVNSWFARQSLIGDTPVLSPGLVPGLADFTNCWEDVRDEILPVLAEQGSSVPFGEISPDHRRIAPDTNWQSFFLQGYGYRSARNLARCPVTAELLGRVPGVVVAFFSILRPGTHIPRHRGLTKAWLNCHLPIAVPQDGGRCEMQVAGRTVRWREGEWLVFDETHPHEVWNDSAQPRIVLFLQVMRPMRLPGRTTAAIMRSIIRRTSFVQDIRRQID